MSGQIKRTITSSVFRIASRLSTRNARRERELVGKFPKVPAGSLPTIDQKSQFSRHLTENSMLHEDMIHYFVGMPPHAHPMAILCSMVNSLSIFYPNSFVDDEDPLAFNVSAARLISMIRTIAAFSYKKSIGEPFVYPRHDLRYCMNFLNMMFDSPVMPYQLDRDVVHALNVFWILHADHEQNSSTAAVRLVGSSRVNLYAAISAGVNALWGPLHGGANQAVVEMLTAIQESGGDVAPFIARAKDKNDSFRLSGFGHRVYKTYDPRAKIIKKVCDKVLAKLKVQDPLLDIAMKLEEVALKDPYFIDHHLYPNVDFYSGIVLRAMGIPVNMFTVLFAIGRLPGWISQWKESIDDPEGKLHRPRQIYTGHNTRLYVAIEDRG